MVPCSLARAAPSTAVSPVLGAGCAHQTRCHAPMTRSTMTIYQPLSVYVREIKAYKPRGDINAFQLVSVLTLIPELEGVGEGGGFLAAQKHMATSTSSYVQLTYASKESGEDHNSSNPKHAASLLGQHDSLAVYIYGASPLKCCDEILMTSSPYNSARRVPSQAQLIHVP